VDLSPSNYDVGPPLNPTSVSSSTFPMVTMQTNDDDTNPIYNLFGSNLVEGSSPYLMLHPTLL